MRGFPVLMYHRVGPRRPPDSFDTILPETFAKHMRWLDWAGFTPIDFDVLLAHRTCGHPLPPRP